MNYLFFFLIGTIFFISCEDDKSSDNLLLNSNIPEIPQDMELDINSDNIDDYIITYAELQTTDYPSSHSSIIGSVNPIGDNQILYRFPDGNLFLTLKDTIRKIGNTEATWYSYPADIVSIDRNNTNWDTLWTINSTIDSRLYLGFKINSDNSDLIGWIQLDINTKTGEVSILDMVISDIEELIVQD